MVESRGPPRNEFNRLARKVYNPIGFSKAYNFVLWVIFAGALLGFTLSRVAYFSFRGIFCSNSRSVNLHAGAGECYYYLYFDRYKVGIQLHIYTILVAGLLVFLQFIPVIRYKAILLHRINGYLVVLLILCSHAGALMVARVAFGGGFSTQIWVGAQVILTTSFFILAIVNIKRLQIDQHRAYMLRAWVYLASIITERIIAIAARTIGPDHNDWWTGEPCGKLVQIFGSPQLVAKLHPACGATPSLNQTDTFTLVHAKYAGGTGDQIAAALDVTFGGSLWLALLLHAIGIELYLWLTPAEHYRLRQVSYQKQLERGFKHPGWAGITSERIGDARPFVPEVQEKRPSGQSELERGQPLVGNVRQSYADADEGKESDSTKG